jgi:hypothetical protein
MSANLDQFFDNSAGNVVSATFKNSSNVTIRTASAIFVDALGAMEVGDVTNEQALPFITCRKSDLVGVDHTCKVVIGTTTYRVIRQAGDGRVAMLLLQI